MTREEYMNALKRALEPFSQEARDAALSFYGEMLDDRMEDGMDEASAVAAMESPEDIASRLGAEGGAPLQDKPDGNGQAAEGFGDEAMEFSSLVNSVLSATEKAEGGIRLTLGNMQEKIEAYEKRQEEKRREEEARKAEAEKAGAAPAQSRERVGEERIGEYEKRILTCPADALRGARLTGGDMPIRVCPGEKDKAELVYYTCEDDPYEAFVENGVLTLRKAGKSGGNRFSFSMLGGAIRMMWSKPSPTVELFLPRDALVDLQAQTSNASIKVNGLHALCDVNLKTSNSRIVMEEMSCKALSAVTSNGRIVLLDVRSKQRVTCSSSNARIEATGVNGREEVTLTTSNGRILAEDVTAGRELRLRTSNGCIEVKRLSAAALTLTTSNSSIRGTLPGRQQDWAIESATSNGRNTLPRQQDGEKPLKVRTSNGSLDLKFEQA